jgi:WD40 repeat protein
MTSRPEFQQFKASAPLVSLSISPDGSQVAIAGREGLATRGMRRFNSLFSFKSTKCCDGRNCQSCIQFTDGVENQREFRLHRRKMASCMYVAILLFRKEIRRANVGKDARNMIATGSTNGNIMVWDLSRPSSQKLDRTVQEHKRAVNRIAVHPREAIMLSASQDGTMKLWDLRSKDTAKVTYDAKSECVRDVQFSPVDWYSFAAAFDNGTVSVWDLRSTTNAMLRYNAHNGPVLTVEWHSDGRLLASGGRDKAIKVCQWKRGISMEKGC